MKTCVRYWEFSILLFVRRYKRPEGGTLKANIIKGLKRDIFKWPEDSQRSWLSCHLKGRGLLISKPNRLILWAPFF